MYCLIVNLFKKKCWDKFSQQSLHSSHFKRNNTFMKRTKPLCKYEMDNGSKCKYYKKCSVVETKQCISIHRQSCWGKIGTIEPFQTIFIRAWFLRGNNYPIENFSARRFFVLWILLATAHGCCHYPCRLERLLNDPFPWLARELRIGSYAFGNSELQELQKRLQLANISELVEMCTFFFPYFFMSWNMLRFESCIYHNAIWIKKFDANDLDAY